MDYLPIFLKLADRPCVVIGGGEVTIARRFGGQWFMPQGKKGAKRRHGREVVRRLISLRF